MNRRTYDHRVTIDAVARALIVHDVPGATFSDVIGSSRRRELVAVRSHAMHLLAGRKWSTKKIGEALNRDHSTVVHHPEKPIDRVLMLRRPADCRLMGAGGVARGGRERLQNGS